MTTDTAYRVRDQHRREILTVGALRAMIEDVDDDVHVVLDDKAGWYDNVRQVIVPGDPDESEFSAVTLFPGHQIDARQF